MAEYLFYRRARTAVPEPDLAGFEVSVWRPSWTSVRPPGLGGKRWPVWWLFDRLFVFRRRWYAVLTIRDAAGVVVHHSALFPRFFRFPSVAADEIQIGDVWTDPEKRGQGLAKTGIFGLAAIADPAARCIWYITEDTNETSRAAAEACGFVVAGKGSRQSRFGLGVLGKYEMTSPKGA